VFPKVRQAVDKALSIDPDLLRRVRHQGASLMYDHDVTGLPRSARAMQLDSSIALTYHRRGLMYAMQGDRAGRGGIQTCATTQPLWLAPRQGQSSLLRETSRRI
jgi:hypothetical protein